MSFFPRFVAPSHEFTPLFRLIDDFATLSRSNLPAGSSVRTFTPRFDVRELKDAYELHGELPGIEQKDLDIKWEDAQTLSIKGRVETRSERGQRETEAAAEPAAEEKQAEEKQAEESDSGSEYHKPTVEDEFVEVNEEGNEAAVAKPEEAAPKEVEKQPENKGRYWISERSVGKFARTFSFQTRIDQDGVKASLKNGILSIIVPKAPIPQPRRIFIE